MTMAAEKTAQGAKPSHIAILLPTIVADVIAPIAIFKLLTWYGVSPLWAIAGSGVAPLLNNLRVWIQSRRLEPLGFLVMAAIAIGTAASFVSGNPFYALTKDSILTGIFGVVFLCSILTRHPLVFFIARQFAIGEDPSRSDAWNALWGYAEYRAAIRWATFFWALAFIIEALTRVVLALTLKPDTVVTIASFMGLGVAAVLMLTQPWLRFARRRVERRYGVTFAL
ncbi:MAG TPA: VC0807 family protein [Rhizomicrobium sp.]|jgi:intracellular septation protein A